MFVYSSDLFQNNHAALLDVALKIRTGYTQHFDEVSRVTLTTLIK